jgi:ABC-type multidrug transport system fused ATPase/permease subunit
VERRGTRNKKVFSVEVLFFFSFLHIFLPSVVPFQAGAISLEKATARYRPDLPAVLKEVSCEIRPCEKIGIAGRTGQC